MTLHAERPSPLVPSAYVEKRGRFRVHVDGLALHLVEVDKPRLLGLERGDDGGLRSRAS